MSAATPSSLLPVPQIRQSHALYLDPVDAEPEAIVVAPPYPGMRAGDTVTFRFAPVNGSPPAELEFTVGPDDVDRPVRWALDVNELWNAYADQAETSYTVSQAGGGTQTSQVQTFTIDSYDLERLPPATIDGQDGTELDPGQFPDGATFRVPLPADAAAGDVVLLHWTGTQSAASTVKWHQLDAADVARAALLMTVEPEWLLANAGRNVTVTWQYAREGAAGTSLPLGVTVLVPLVLDPPQVERAEPEGEDGNGDSTGYLQGDLALSGVFIKVPPAEAIEDAVSIEMHWEGHPQGGQHVASSPHSPDAPLRFHIPKTAVAANIGGQSRRFRVFYRVVLGNGRTHTSRPFLLWVKPLLTSAYGAPQCREAEGKLGLSLADVPPEGAEVYVITWPFEAVGQRVTLRMSGVAAGGGAVEHTARDAVPVTQAELDAKTVGGRLPRAMLQGLSKNTQFTLRAEVSYDGGETAIRFASNAITWLG